MWYAGFGRRLRPKPALQIHVSPLHEARLVSPAAGEDQREKIPLTYFWSLRLGAQAVLKEHDMVAFVDREDFANGHDLETFSPTAYSDTPDTTNPASGNKG